MLIVGSNFFHTFKILGYMHVCCNELRQKHQQVHRSIVHEFMGDLWIDCTLARSTALIFGFKHQMKSGASYLPIDVHREMMPNVHSSVIQI